MPRLFLLALLAVGGSTLATAAEPLHVRIDQIIDATRIGPAAPEVTDADFLRRIYLDLAGSIPSPDEARAFLADKDPQKRTKLIDRLLASPQYVRQTTDFFHTMLMERRSDAADWLNFLRSAVEQNKPWNQMAAEILGNDGANPKLKGPINYFTARTVEPNLMTREVGRMFFGMDLQCAQCHNHPLIDDYLQSDYYGVFAFLNRTYLFQPNEKKPAQLAEKAEGLVKFKSVFTGDEGETRPSLPGGSQIAEPTFKKGEEYQVKPDKKKPAIRPVPKFSRRAILAKLVLEGQNPAFRRNIVNRLWGHLMGRGLVHPPDLHHSDNPPSHPELLKLLADEFAAMKFNVKAFLRELALTKTYQRSVALSPQLIERAKTVAPRLTELEAEGKKIQTDLAVLQKASTTLAVELADVQKKLASVEEQLTKATAAVAPAEKAAAPLVKALADAQKQLTASQALAAPLTVAAAKAKQAAQLSTDDKQLQELALGLGKKATAINSLVANLLKSVAEKSIAATKATQQLATLKQSVQTISAEKSRLAGKRTELSAGQRRIAGQISDLRLRDKVVQRRIETVKTYGDYVGRLQKAKTSAAAAEVELVKFRPLQQAADALQSELQEHQWALTTAQQQFDTAMTAIADAQKQLADKQTVVHLVAESAAKTKAAQQQLVEDADLAGLVTALENKSKKLSAQVAALQQTLAAQNAAKLAAEKQMAKSSQALEPLDTKYKAVDKQLAPLAAKAKPLVDQASKDQEALDEAYETLTKHWSEQFVLGSLEPLSPEQMAWSVMQATGMTARQRAATTAEINKKKPMKPEELKDPAKLAARAVEIERAMEAKLKANVALFVKLFAANAGQPQYDFFATAEQALFFANGGQVRSWLAPSGDNLGGRLMKMEKPDQLAEELYLSVLTRRPTAEEVADVTAYLDSRPKEKSAVVQELVWGLLTSSEFRFHH